MQWKVSQKKICLSKSTFILNWRSHHSLTKINAHNRSGVRSQVAILAGKVVMTNYVCMYVLYKERTNVVQEAGGIRQAIPPSAVCIIHSRNLWTTGLCKWEVGKTYLCDLHLLLYMYWTFSTDLNGFILIISDFEGNIS